MENDKKKLSRNNSNNFILNTGSKILSRSNTNNGNQTPRESTKKIENAESLINPKQSDNSNSLNDTQNPSPLKSNQSSIHRRNTSGNTLDTPGSSQFKSGIAKNSGLKEGWIEIIMDHYDSRLDRVAIENAKTEVIQKSIMESFPDFNNLAEPSSREFSDVISTEKIPTNLTENKIEKLFVDVEANEKLGSIPFNNEELLFTRILDPENIILNDDLQIEKFGIISDKQELTISNLKIKEENKIIFECRDTGKLSTVVFNEEKFLEEIKKPENNFIKDDERDEKLDFIPSKYEETISRINFEENVIFLHDEKRSEKLNKLLQFDEELIINNIKKPENNFIKDDERDENLETIPDTLEKIISRINFEENDIFLHDEKRSEKLSKLLFIEEQIINNIKKPDNNLINDDEGDEKLKTIPETFEKIISGTNFKENDIFLHDEKRSEKLNKLLLFNEEQIINNIKKPENNSIKDDECDEKLNPIPDRQEEITSRINFEENNKFLDDEKRSEKLNKLLLNEEIVINNIKKPENNFIKDDERHEKLNTIPDTLEKIISSINFEENDKFIVEEKLSEKLNKLLLFNEEQIINKIKNPDNNSIKDDERDEKLNPIKDKQNEIISRINPEENVKYISYDKPTEKSNQLSFIEGKIIDNIKNPELNFIKDSESDHNLNTFPIKLEQTISGINFEENYEPIPLEKPCNKLIKAPLCEQPIFNEVLMPEISFCNEDTQYCMVNTIPNKPEETMSRINFVENEKFSEQPPEKLSRESIIEEQPLQRIKKPENKLINDDKHEEKLKTFPNLHEEIISRINFEENVKYIPNDKPTEKWNQLTLIEGTIINHLKYPERNEYIQDYNVNTIPNTRTQEALTDNNLTESPNQEVCLPVQLPEVSSPGVCESAIKMSENNFRSKKVENPSSNLASSIIEEDTRDFIRRWTQVNDTWQLNSTLETSKAIKEISWIAFPTLFLYLAVYMQQTINFIFIGHTNPQEDKKDILNAIGISHLYINCTLLSIVIGIVSGFEALGSKAYDAKKYYSLGLYFQRAQLIGLIMTIIILIFQFFYATRIIGLFGIEQRVLSQLDEYIRIMMFMVLFEVQYSINFRYLNVIGKSYVNIIILAICTLLHPLWCYIFISYLGLGIKGAAYSLIISQFLLSTSGIIYILIKQPVPKSIFVYNRDSFIGWFEYLKVSFPYAFVICAELWAFETLSIIAICISKLDFTVHILMANFNAYFCAISIGFGMAGSILISKSIRTSSFQVAKKYAIITYLYGIIFMSLFCTIIFILKNRVLVMYTDEEDLIKKGEDVLMILCSMNIFDISQTIFGSICRGLGKQYISTLIVLINLYITQTSMAVVFGYLLKYGVLGIWFGFMIKCIVCSLVYLVILLVFDWEKIQVEILKKINENPELISEDENCNQEGYRQSLLGRASEL